MSQHDLPQGDDEIVRPYLLTGGRTRAAGVEVGMETLLIQMANSETAAVTLNRTQRQVWDACETTTSAAEISAHLKLPFGVVRVIIGDLAQEGLITVHESTADGDVELVRRLINAVRSI